MVDIIEGAEEAKPNYEEKMKVVFPRKRKNVRTKLVCPIY